ncbi:hypothetical protein I4U23_031572 [Adineta vaga]|nr:hypothetical protein I4U23_031572 [Adineta vaga]
MWLNSNLPQNQIPHELKFISSITPIFHQIRTSDFVRDAWLNYVNYRPFLEAQFHYFADFRHSAYAFFQFILMGQVNNMMINRLGTNLQLFVITSTSDNQYKQAWSYRPYPDNDNCTRAKGVYCTLSTEKVILTILYKTFTHPNTKCENTSQWNVNSCHQ